MAHVTDEISERVARALFEQIVRLVDFGSDFTQDMFAIGEAGMKDGSAAIKEMLKKVHDALGDREFQKLINEGAGQISTGQMDEIIKRCNINPSTIKIADENVERFEELLNNAGILYAKIAIKEDNCRMFVFLESESDRVTNLAKIIYAEKGQITELSPELFLQTEEPKNLKEIGGLDKVELELFRHYAQKKNNVLFTVVPEDNGKYTVFANTSTSKAAQETQRALTEMGWALSGNNGAKVREQIEYRIAGRTRIYKSIEDAAKELYIVSKTHPDEFVHITNNEFEIYKGGNLLKVVAKTENNLEEFRDECYSWCDKLQGGAVVMSPEEFNNGITAELLESKRTLDLFNAEIFEEMVESQMMNEMVRLVSTGLDDKKRQREAMEKGNKQIRDVEAKMSLDDEGNSEIDYWDESVTYSSFAQYENIADEEQERNREYQFEHFKDAAFYSKRNFAVTDHAVEGDIDAIIERAEIKRRERTAAAAQMRENMKNNKDKEEQEL